MTRPGSRLARRAMRRSPIKRGTTPIRPRNPARKAREFVRCFHSAERVAFVRALPCVVTGQSPCDNAHTEGDGAGRRAGYATIIPLIRRLHRELHRTGVVTFTTKYRLDFPALSAATEAAWQAHSRRTAA